MDTVRALEQLDLTPTESAVYLFLLQNGPSYAKDLQTALELQKVPAYRALNALRAKEYIEAYGETRNQRFAARPLQTLLDAYDAKTKQIAEARNNIESLVRDLANKQNELYKQNKISIYEGKEGYRLWNEERLRKDVTLIREGGSDAFVTSFFLPEELDGYMRNYIKRRVQKGINIRILHDDGEPLRAWDRSSDAILKQTHSTDMPHGLPVYISTFGTRFGFYTQQGGKYLGVIVDDPMLTTMINWFFDVAWQHGREV